ncbi:MAG: hypothetical protein ACW975_03180 [Candidatus Thorarchaeota archaeon]
MTKWTTFHKNSKRQEFIDRHRTVNEAVETPSITTTSTNPTIMGLSLICTPALKNDEDVWLNVPQNERKGERKPIST